MKPLCNAQRLLCSNSYLYVSNISLPSIRKTRSFKAARVFYFSSMYFTIWAYNIYSLDNVLRDNNYYIQDSKRLKTNSTHLDICRGNEKLI